MPAAWSTFGASSVKKAASAPESSAHEQAHTLLRMPVELAF